MDHFSDPADSEDPARLEREVQRLVQRLRHMPVTRLSQPGPDQQLSRAAQVFALAQDLQGLTAALAGEERRALPELPDHSAPDVVAVMAADLIEAIRVAGTPAVVATGDEPALDAARACRTAVAAVRALRAAI